MDGRSSISHQQKLIISLIILLVFLVLTSMLFASAKGGYFPSLRQIIYHSSWILFILVVIDLILVQWSVKPSILPFRIQSRKEKIRAISIGTLFILTFFPLGNYLKHHYFFFEDWMWYCVLWVFGLSITLVLTNYLTIDQPHRLEKVGVRFIKADYFLSHSTLTKSNIIFLCLASSVVLLFGVFVCFWTLGGIPHVQDSVAQFFQAKIFSYGRMTFPAPEHPKFFERIYVVANEGRWYTIYPPGHALVMSIGMLLRVPQLVNPLISAGIIWLLYLFTRKVSTPFSSKAGVILLALSPFFLFMGAGFMNHPTALFFLLAYLLFLLKAGETESTQSLAIFMLAAGLCFGFAFITRPMTSLAFLLSGILWLVVLNKKRVQYPIRTILFFLIGTLPFAIFYLTYNASTTGSPFLTGYVNYFNGNPLGFGYRPWGPEPLGPKIPNEVYHTPVRGVANTICNLNALNLYLFGWPIPSLLFAFIPFLPGVKRKTSDWLCVFSILAVFLIYFFYFFQDYCYGPRFTYETIPFLILLSARGIEITVQRFEQSEKFTPNQARGLVFGALVVFFLFAFGTVWIERFAVMGDSYWGTNEGIAAMVKKGVEEDDAVIFVENGDDYVALFSYLEPTLDRGWIVAHDYGCEENQKLLQNYPEWPVYLLRLKETDKPFIFKSELEKYRCY